MSERRSHSSSSWSLDWQGSFLTVRLKGRVRLEDMLEAIDAAVGDPRLDGTRFVLYDFRGIEGWDMTEEQGSVASGMSRVPRYYLRGSVRVAFVVTSPTVRAFMLRFPQNAPEPTRRYFEDIEAARLWLTSSE